MSPESAAAVNPPQNPPPLEAGRWHSHGWNRPLSWRLIFRFAPGLPRAVQRPLRHLLSSLCFVWMTKERAAVRRNLRRVTGAGELAVLRLSYRLFFNYSGFLTAYAQLNRFGAEWLRPRVAGAEQTSEALRSVLARGRGAIIVTMHLGHWDLGLSLLRGLDVPVHVVMREDQPPEVARFAQQLRAGPRLHVHQSAGSPLLAVKLMAALTRGELVTVQADRAFGQGTLPVAFFGAEAPLPSGPVRLAMATGAPLLPIFTLMEPDGTYRLMALEPMLFERERGDRVERAVAEAMPRLARMMESVVSRHPDQWFNFFDVWPAAEAGAGRQTHAA
ncbi:MAG TPA: lysophospholipid acyltransferase family protein [Candidatus Polarisedimenticolia bacterium]|nr:lysophospholipid acyltransferase family protein [Candidatus Polarisedimenticolia bacterium]